MAVHLAAGATFTRYGRLPRRTPGVAGVRAVTLTPRTDLVRCTDAGAG